MKDAYGNEIAGIVQYKAMSTTPNTGQLPPCFNEVVIYAYYLLNCQGAHSGRLELNVEQAASYCKKNKIKIIKSH